MPDNRNITVHDALKAMILYWDGVFERTRSDDIADTLSDLSLLADESTADPAAYGDFVACIDRVLAGDDERTRLQLTPAGPAR